MKNYIAVIIGLGSVMFFSSFTSRKAEFNSSYIYERLNDSETRLKGDGFTVYESYEKMDLFYGSLDQNGEEIDHVFVKYQFRKGEYEVELVNGPGNLYQLKGFDLFIELDKNFGDAEDGILCILKVEGNDFLPIVYKID